MNKVNSPGGSALRSFDDPWDEPSRIVIGIDIGTTQSGVAFAYLRKGVKPAIQRVSQWPGQAHDRQGKIPTVLWYDETNKAVRCGAEATTRQAKDAAVDSGWKLAQYFKLHLHPSHLIMEHELDLKPLPFSVPLSQIYSDFLKYLFQHTQSYFEDSIIGGEKIWQQYKSTMEIILAHPNGWEFESKHFSAEASVHFCTLYSDIGSELTPGMTFAVCDAGGSTVDTTVYTVKSLSPIRLEETHTSDCVQAGAIFIDESADTYLRKLLKRAGLSQEEIDVYSSQGVENFEQTSKRLFKDVNSDQLVEIAPFQYSNSAIRVRRGALTLQGSTVKTFFDPCVDRILESVNSQLEGRSVSNILLVGGFGESPFLRKQLKLRFESIGCDVTFTKEQAAKAVADGTIIWYSANIVTKRVPRYSYGIEVLVPYNPRAQDHKRRTTVKWPTGVYVKGGWSQIANGGDPVGCDEVTRKPYYREYTTPNPTLNKFTEEIWCHTFKDTPQWMRFKPGSIMPGFNLGCSVVADLGHLRGALRAHISPKGSRYWSLSFNVCIRFGRTEYQAFLEWEEKGETYTSKAHLLSTSGPA